MLTMEVTSLEQDIEQRYEGLLKLHNNYQAHATEIVIGLERKLADLQTKYTALETAVRAFCNERDIEYDDRLIAAMRHFVGDDADAEAMREMEER